MRFYNEGMSHEPIACNLTTADAARQALRWSDLRKYAVSTEHLEHGVALTLKLEVADAVEDLAAGEALCCSFLSITTTRTAQHVRVAIESENPDALPAIQALVGLVTP